MSGPFSDTLRQLEGPAVLWQSPPLAVPASGAGHDFGLHIGLNRGWIAPYLRNAIAADGYSPADTIQLIPHWVQPVGSPGGGVSTRVNPGRLTARVMQGIYELPRGGGTYATLDGTANYKLLYRGVFAAGLGPYPLKARGQPAPAGPILCGETAEFALAAGSTASEVANSASIDPFMWTLFGRCLVADGGCQPGDIMAFGSFKGSGTARGWTTAYSPATRRFILGQYLGAPQMSGKDGALFNPTPANWAFFLRFIGTPIGGALGMPTHPRKRSRAPAPLLWASPEMPFGAGLKPISFACPESFSPALVNALYVCKNAEFGYSVGDWVPVHVDDNNGNGGGFAAVFSNRTVTLAPQAFNAQQYAHSLVDGTFNPLTAANWSWCFVFVG